MFSIAPNLVAPAGPVPFSRAADVSLLDRSNEIVTVFPEVTTDSDGNTVTQPSATGIETRAWISPIPQSGTSARRAEQDDGGGFFTEQVYLAMST